VISGVSDCVAGNVGYYVPFMLDAQLRPICVLHNERWPEIPSVPTFEEVTGQRNISYAGRTLAAAPGLAEDKKQIYVDAIGHAIGNPDYVIKEINNKNHLMFLEGEAMWERLKRSKELVAEVKFWEAES
jgi:tripartite-type tricarboxylate transporter receptor subunit TctC